MNRFLLAISLLLGLGWSVSPAGATPLHGGRSLHRSAGHVHNMRAPLPPGVVSGVGTPKQVRATHPFAGATSSGRAAMQAPTHADITVSGASQLRMPASAYPAGFRLITDRSITAPDADANTYQADTHSLSYVQVGMLGGWYGEAMEDLPDGGQFYLTYMGSYYTTAQGAQSAFSDAASGWTSHSPIPCGVASVPECVDITIPIFTQSYAGDAYTGYFRMFQRSNALFEGACLILQDDYNAQRLNCLRALDNLSNRFLGLLSAQPASTPASPTSTPVAVTPSPTPVATASPTPTVGPSPSPTPTPVVTSPPARTDFTLDAVRIQRKNTDGAPAIRAVKTGSTVYLVIDWTVKSLPAGMHPTYSYDVTATKGGKVLGRAHDAFTGTQASYSPGPYVATFKLRLRQAGTYIFKGKVSAGGITQSSGTSLTVKAKGA